MTNRAFSSAHLAHHLLQLLDLLLHEEIGKAEVYHLVRINLQRNVSTQGHMKFIETYKPIST